MMSFKFVSAFVLLVALVSLTSCADAFFFKRNNPRANAALKVVDYTELSSGNEDDTDAFIPFQARQADPSIPTMTATATATLTPTITTTPSISVSPTASLSFGVSPSNPPSSTPTVSLSFGVSPSPTVSFTASMSALASPSTTIIVIIVSPTTSSTSSPSVSAVAAAPAVSPSNSAGISPTASASSTTAPTSCSAEIEPNFGVECKLQANRNRVRGRGPINIKIWTEFNRFRWNIDATDTAQGLYIDWVATFITTRSRPSTRTILNRRVNLGPGVFEYGATQPDAIDMLPNPSRRKKGCCGSKAKAYTNIRLCRPNGRCFRKDLVTKFNLQCKTICSNGGTPVKMTFSRMCPACI